MECRWHMIYKAKGSILYTSLIAIVLTATIGGYAAKQIANDTNIVISDHQNIKALHAAITAKELALSQLHPLDDSGSTCSNVQASLTFTNKEFTDCTATITCSSTTVANQALFTVSTTSACTIDGKTTSSTASKVSTIIIP